MELFDLQEYDPSVSYRFCRGYRFSYRPTYRPLSFVLAHACPNIKPISYSLENPASCLSQLREGLSVMCINNRSPLYGCIGVVSHMVYLLVLVTI